eukprot:603026-Pelagomonas_calceolata.AAC.1
MHLSGWLNHGVGQPGAPGGSQLVLVSPAAGGHGGLGWAGGKGGKGVVQPRSTHPGACMRNARDIKKENATRTSTLLHLQLNLHSSPPPKTHTHTKWPQAHKFLTGLAPVHAVLSAGEAVTATLMAAPSSSLGRQLARGAAAVAAGASRFEVAACSRQ